LQYRIVTFAIYGYKEDSGTDSTTLYAKGTNHSLSFLIGPVYRIDAGKKLFIDIRALVGYVHTHLTGFQIFYEDYTTNSMAQKESSGGGLGFQGGLAVGYYLTKKIPSAECGLLYLEAQNKYQL